MKYKILCKTEDVGDEVDDKKCLLDFLKSSELDIYNKIIKDSE